MADGGVENIETLNGPSGGDDEAESSLQDDAINFSDFNDPLYIHPSDNTAYSFSIKYTGGPGFAQWKRAVTMSLKAKNKYGLVNGQVTEPEKSSERYPMWERSNNMVMTWIVNSVAKDIGESIVYNDTAHQMWKSLCKRFELVNGPEIYAIQKEISQLKQQGDSISSYYTRLNALWDRLSGSRKPLNCSCGAASEIEAREQEDKLMKFLDGLNENFKQAKGAILLMNPLPDIEQASSILAQDEKGKNMGDNQEEGSENSLALAQKPYSTGTKKPMNKRINNKSPSTSTSSGKKSLQRKRIVRMCISHYL